MEAVPRMPMIWLDLKEAGEFAFNAAVKKFVLKNYGENPENYNEELRKLEALRQNAVNVPRDFEGCSTLRKYFGQLHYLQSRIPMGAEQEAAVPIAWTEIFSGKTVTHEDIKYEQACVLYNLGALHSMLGAMDKRVSEEGMKVSCTHFQCAAGAFTYLRDHFPHSYSVDMSHQILNLNINLMLGQAQECLLEKSMLDNRKSFLVARISAQVVDYYKEACRALENSETASLLGKIQKDWKKLVQMKIYYFAAVAHLHMGKQAEEQQKFGERVVYFQSALDKLNEAIKLAKGQPETVQEALRFTMDVIGGKYNSAKKDNDFIYHEAVPALDTLQAVKGAPLVKALPVNPTDPAVTGPDIFAKLVPMAAHEASSLYSEEKAKLLRDVMAKIEAKNEVLDQFMDSMQLDPETVDNLDMYSHVPPVLMEKCAALSVRPDTVKNLVQSMQVLSGVFTDVEASLKEIRDLLQEDEAQERKLQELLGKGPAPRGSPPPPSAGLAEVSKECSKYMEVHEKASFTNTELHKAMNLHIGNLRLLSGPLEQVRAALPSPALTEDDKQVLQNLKRILVKVQEMRDQRVSLEQQLREMIQKDDITTSLVTADRSEMKKLFEEQLKKYDQIKVYLEQNLAAQENILKALTDANVKYAAVRKALAEVEHKWNATVQTLVASYEAYEDLMKKSQEGKDFYTDLEGKAAKLLEKARAACQAAEANRQQILEKEMKKHPPPRPTAPKPALQKKPPELEAGGPEAADVPQLSSLGLADLPEELRSLPPDVLAGHLARLPPSTLAALALDPALAAGLRPPAPLPPPPLALFAPCQAGERPAAARAALRPLPCPARALRGACLCPGTLSPRLQRGSGAAGAAPAALCPPGGRPPPQLSPFVCPPALPRRPPGPRRGAARLRGAPRAAPTLVPAARPRCLLRPGPSRAARARPPQAPSRGAGPRGCPATTPGWPRAGPGHPAGHHHRGQHPGPHLQLRGPPTAPQPGPGRAPRWLPAPPAPGRPPRLLPLRPGGAAAAFRAAGSTPLPSWAAPPRRLRPRGAAAARHGAASSPPGPGGPPAVPPPSPLPAPRAPPAPAALPAPGPAPAAPPVCPAALLWPRGAAAPPSPWPAPAVPPALPAARPGQAAPPRAPPAHGGPALHRVGAQSPRAERAPSTAPAPRPGGAAARARQLPRPPLLPQPCPVPPRAPRHHGHGPPPAFPRQPVGPPPRRPFSQPGPEPDAGPGGGAGPSGPSPAPSPQPAVPLQPPALVPGSGAPPQRPPPSLTPGAAPGPGEAPFQRQSSSTDDLLSSSPESQHGGSKAAVGQPLLQPTKADAKEGQKPKALQLIENDPYEKPERVLRLLAELDRFRGLVERLERPAPGGAAATELDAVWKELQDAQERDARQLSIAIARCYSMKNRHQDIMPYDRNRVVLRSGKDDYINASRVEDLSPYCPTVIATQAPLLGTAADFWLMIYEQKVSVVVMLVSEQELDKQKVLRYFPAERGQPVVQGPVTLVLTGLKAAPTHVERMITLQYRDQSLKRTVVHLQFTSWPELGLPDSKGSLLRFIQEVHGHYLHQRPLHTPVVVHCSSGVGRTGAFCLLYAAMQEVEAGNGIPDLAQLVKRLRQQRKHMLQEKLHLKFCYEAVLQHAEQVLHRHGVGTPPVPKPPNSTSPKLYFHQDPQDLVLGGDLSISSIQATIAKLSIKPAGAGGETGGAWGPDPAPLAPLPALPDGALDGVLDGSAAPLPEPTPPAPPVPEPPAEAESSNHVEESPEPPAAEPPAPPASAPSSSSLELLASLTPEAFTLDASLKGKQRMNKQNFLQAQTGEGLRGPRPSDDPLSMLDPLWTLNKS
ncbi:LOW QUALITY PROTEIN: tyrosine-protein phosphatase non-receptor type 23 [Cygnus olor]|uniref:LOW QUALITY PROTEIN: tyrosine-protein phosphatase non-receptor type 23 n=1 Tax=Cygnus olor TaxID=8869 RepID=UPI001ADE994C|nr:LOW QUALITY PROTEIN: tyrosine-protein phosphatase non-receptor type 23 [Cygnus olor]